MSLSVKQGHQATNAVVDDLLRRAFRFASRQVMRGLLAERQPV